MKERKNELELFGSELDVLDAAMREIAAAENQANPLLPRYEQLASNYKKLLKLSSKIVSISDRQQLHLKQVEGAFKDLLDNAGQGFLTVGPDLRVEQQYSAECSNIFAGPIENANILELLRDKENEEQNHIFAQVFTKVFQTDSNKGAVKELKSLPQKIKINGKYINIECKLIKRYERETKKQALMMILSDISEKQAAEEKIHYLSYHDKLTGLFNRAYVDSILPELNSELHMPTSLIMADMNGLKLSNDVFGHVAGDKLLQNIAKVFQQCCRQSDIIARWGGDEFIIILPRTGEEACISVCERIKSNCRNSEADPIELSVALGTSTRHTMKEDIFECFRQAENLMYQDKLLTSKDNRQRIIISLERKLCQIEGENENHAARIAKMTELIADELRLGAEQKEELRQLASMHDIGKLVIPPEILEKSTSLTPDEWDSIRNHCDAGFRMARAINEPNLADAILAHHEHFDGRGYPQGLKGEEIPLNARIIAVVDAYESMTNKRPYRQALDSETAIHELLRCSGSQFDPQLVELLAKRIKGDQTVKKSE